MGMSKVSSQFDSKTRSRATIADVARQAGVSIATVSRVINQTAPVAPETVAQVQAAIAELNYRPQAAAQVLASQKTNTILQQDFTDIATSRISFGTECKRFQKTFTCYVFRILRVT